MGILKSLVNEVLQDTMYEARVIMRSSRDENLTIVTDNLRGVCGITVVTVTGPAKVVSSKIEKTELKVKFFLSAPTLKQHLQKMEFEARKITGVFSFSVMNVQKVVSRIYKK